MGTYLAARAALPVFRRQASGHIIVISSIVGKRGVPFMGAYAATKFAQAGLAECLRAEVHGSAIHVSVVFPISTETEFHQVMARESGYATRARRASAIGRRCGQRDRAGDRASGAGSVSAPLSRWLPC